MQLVTSSIGAGRAAARRNGGSDEALPVILDFQWPSTAIANAPVPRSARRITWIVATMVVVLITAMGLVPVDQVVTARGIVVPSAPVIVVQPLETAIVRAIDVKEGQAVHKGQLLARLDPTFAAADLGALQAQAASLTAEVARLQAESEGKRYAATPGHPDTALQYSIFAQHQAEYNSTLENFSRKLAEFNALAARSHSDVAGYTERLAVASNIERMRSQLQAMQVGSRLNTLTATDNRAEIARDLANAQHTEQSAKQSAASVEAERTTYIWSWKAKVSEQLALSSRKLAEVREQLNKATLRRNLVELRAEHDGVVQSVARVSVGSVLQSGQHFMSLVPTDTPLEIEANISGDDSGFVHVDDPVTVKFDTFPFARYGRAQGKLRIISPSSFTPQDEARNPTSAVPETRNEPSTVYRARISIDQLEMHDVPGGFRLVPGMPVTTDIQIGKRTVLSYLLGRIVPIAEEGMREP